MWIRIKFAELEVALGDKDRARGLYELAVNQPVLDMPEVVWKAYIDFETEEEEFGNARKLYRRLLDRTQHVKVCAPLTLFHVARVRCLRVFHVATYRVFCFMWLRTGFYVSSGEGIGVSCLCCLGMLLTYRVSCFMLLRYRVSC